VNIGALMQLYLKNLASTGRAFLTIKGTRYALAGFSAFLDKEGISEVQELTADLLRDYQEELSLSQTATGRTLSLRSQGLLLSRVKGFTRYLKECDYLVGDPGAALVLPKRPKCLPKVILNQQEVKQLLDAPDGRSRQGYRNRIILELLYDTAIRRAEVSAIKLSDLDLDSGFILIHGKGDKERVVPLSTRVSDLVRSYILMVRPFYVKGEDPGYLILNRFGSRMDANGVWAVVKRCLHLSGLKRNVSTHTFRHTCATHMLKNGAPIRHLQEMLGHESLESTQIYTRVTISDLKEVHRRFHPLEKMKEE
jgi:integrase/recombinase XerD